MSSGSLLKFLTPVPKESDDVPPLQTNDGEYKFSIPCTLGSKNVMSKVNVNFFLPFQLKLCPLLLVGNRHLPPADHQLTGCWSPPPADSQSLSLVGSQSLHWEGGS